MRFQVISDVHLEFFTSCSDISPPQIPVKSTVLCLLGDIGLPYAASERERDLYEDWVVEQASKFPHVLVLAGNHEYYSSAGMETVKRRIRYVCAKAKEKSGCQCRFLDNESVEIDGCVFIGSTLWSLIDGGEQETLMMQFMVNDYRRIFIEDGDSELKPIRVTNTNALHRESVDFIQRELDRCEREQKEAIVLTHHAPTFQHALIPEDLTNGLKSMSATDLSHLFEIPALTCWCFGHTHHSSSFWENGTLITSNQAGYCTDRDDEEHFDLNFDLNYVVDTKVKEEEVNSMQRGWVHLDHTP